jgi:hypothetical protein
MILPCPCCVSSNTSDIEHLFLCLSVTHVIYGEVYIQLPLTIAKNMLFELLRFVLLINTFIEV